MDETKTLPPGEQAWRALDDLIDKRAEGNAKANLEAARLKASERHPRKPPRQRGNNAARLISKQLP